MSLRRKLTVIRSAGRTILVAIALTIAFDGPLPVATALVVALAGLAVVIARLPRHPDKPPVDRTSLTGPTLAVYYGSSLLLIPAIGWLLVALFLAEDSQDLALPFLTFVLIAVTGKWNLAAVRRTAAEVPESRTTVANPRGSADPR